MLVFFFKYLFKIIIIKSQRRNIPELGSTYGVIVSIVGNGHSDLNSNPGKVVCISLSTNTLGKHMNPTILPPAMGK